LEEDQKCIILAQLKAENFELMQKERDYDILRTQLLDMEHRFRILQEDKMREEKEAHLKEEQAMIRNENIQAEIIKLRGLLDDKQAVLKDIEIDISRAKRMGEAKNTEALQFKNELATASEKSVYLYREKKLVETDLSASHAGKLSAQQEAESLELENKRLSLAESEAKERLKDCDMEVARLNRKLNDISIEIDAARKQLSLKDKELESSLEGKTMNQREANSFASINQKLSDERTSLNLKVRDLEIQWKKAKQELDDTMSLLNIKEKDLKNARMGKISSEEKSLAARTELYKLKKENENLHFLLDKYRGDADFQKRLTEEEAKKKIDVAKEKQKLETEAILKEIEARKAKEELMKVQDRHEMLLDNKIQMSQELNALKQHADVLESQNMSVFTYYYIVVT
jgi:hypothetical protein